MGDGKQLKMIHGMEQLKHMLGAGKGLPERLLGAVGELASTCARISAIPIIKGINIL